MKDYRMDLRLFDDGGAGAAAATSGAATTGDAVSTGTEGNQPARDFDAEFDAMVKGDFKDAYNKKVQGIVKDRLKGSKQTESKLKDAEALLSLVGERYGWDGKDMEALRASLESDKAYLEEEALEKGMTVEQLAQIKRMERENKVLREQQRQADERAAFEQKFAGWNAEAEALANVYPGLNLMEEFNNPTFVRLLDSGVGVKAAYQATHFDELMGGALQYTAQQTQKAVLDGVKANGMRPNENGTKGSNGANQRIDVTKLTKEDRQRLMDEVRRDPNKRITFR
jgi:hypothetical protein